MISIFPLRNFHLDVATFQQHLHMSIYISKLIRYSGACGSYQNFLDSGSLLTRKLMHQGFLLVKLQLSLRKLYSRQFWPTRPCFFYFWLAPQVLWNDLRGIVIKQRHWQTFWGIIHVATLRTGSCLLRS
jgi:hypothetical protein